MDLGCVPSQRSPLPQPAQCPRQFQRVEPAKPGLRVPTGQAVWFERLPWVPRATGLSFCWDVLHPPFLRQTVQSPGGLYAQENKNKQVNKSQPRGQWKAAPALTLGLWRDSSFSSRQRQKEPVPAAPDSASRSLTTCTCVTKATQAAVGIASNSPRSPGWPQTHGQSFCVCLLRAGITGMRHHTQVNPC